MKKIFTLLCLATVLLYSCSGNDDHTHEEFDTIGQTFEIANVNFTSTDGLSAAIDFPIPNNVEVFESDVPLVYILDPVLTAEQGTDVWEPLPRTFLFNDGGFAQYRYNFIFDDATGIFDIQVVLESDDFAGLDSSFTSGQIFRVVIVPSAFAKTTDLDFSKFSAVQEALQLEF